MSYSQEHKILQFSENTQTYVYFQSS